MTQYQCEALQAVQYPLVNKFYKDSGYGGKAGRQEVVYVLRDSNNHNAIAAAVRLQPKQEGWWFLRAMVVKPHLRAQGLGRQLLRSLESWFNGVERKVYCYPFQHLQDFYGQAGFVTVSDNDLDGDTRTTATVPHFMLQGLNQYRQQGRDIRLMLL